MPYIVLGIVCVGIATLVLFQDLPYWRHTKELKSRKPLSPLELQKEYLPDVPLSVVEKLLQIVEDQFGADPRLVRPNDNHCLINDDLDSSVFVTAIETAFGFKFAQDAIESLDGSFGSIARHCAKCSRMV